MSKIVVSRRVTPSEEGGHRLQVWVSETSDNIPATIFAYQQIPPVPNSDTPASIFVYICSYADIFDLPENEAGDCSPFFRRYYLDLTFQSMSVMESKWDLMLTQIQLLIEDIVRTNELSPTEVEVIDLP
jgi:hypothetical protein